MKRTHKVVAGLVTTLALGLAAAAYAHPGGGFGPCAGDGPGMGYGPRAGMAAPGMGYGPRDGRDPAAYADIRLAHLKSALKITAEQDGAWQAFAAKTKKQAEDMQAVRSKLPQAAGPAPERLGQYTEAMKARLASMETMAAAFKDLYAQLNPEQKAIADQRFDGISGMGRHPMGYGMRNYR